MNRRRKDKPSKAREATANWGVLRSMDDIEQAVTAIQNLGFLAAYDSVPHVRRILVETCTEKFVEKLRELHTQGKVVGQVCLATAAKEVLLFDPEWEEKVQIAVHLIRMAKEKRDEKALGRFRSAMQSPRLKPGPKTTPESNRWKIEMLHDLATGKMLKQATRQPKRGANSASAELAKYCSEFYNTCYVLRLETKEAWEQGPEGVWSKERFERFGFSFPKDLSAAEEAYRRGKESADRFIAKSGLVVSALGVSFLLISAL